MSTVVLELELESVLFVVEVDEPVLEVRAEMALVAVLMAGSSKR
jgi:hypothetical protein